MQSLAPSLSPERKKLCRCFGAAHETLKLRSTCRCDPFSFLFQLIFLKCNGRRKSMKRCRTRVSRPLRFEGVAFRRLPLLIRSERTSRIIHILFEDLRVGGQFTVTYNTYDAGHVEKVRDVGKSWVPVWARVKKTYEIVYHM